MTTPSEWKVRLDELSAYMRETPETDMTLTRARLIVRNRLAYLPREVRDAAVWLLGSMAATAEDMQDASHAILVGTRDR